MPAYSDVKLWTPQLHPYKEDTEIWVKDPIKTIEFASDWLSFCIGGEVTARMLDEVLSLSWEVILEVLYLKFSHVGSPDGDDLTRALLLLTQVQNFCSSFGQVDVPAFCWMDDLEQCDTSDSDSDSDYMEGVDVTYVDDNEEMLDCEGSQSNSDLGDIYVPDFIQSQPIGLPTKDPSLPLPLPASINPASLPEIWCQHMRVFFYPTDVVVDLRQMHKLPANVWKTKEFQMALEVLHPACNLLSNPSQETGLLNLMHTISKPGNLLETMHTDIEQSFHFHNWKRSYSLLICEWTKAKITKEEHELVGFEMFTKKSADIFPSRGQNQTQITSSRQKMC
ncbi:hypothetical protein B0H17DRAFT_1125200 [Mycena rosella]|uniref:Uncharacterized protein n=1 Tax=Mycena rosella TaxID=1033263 RepID=A0AAD7MA48_MYCRO|nr:hypothetical protein B0H17DRAFT_1125200 [Mycena rosella]